MLDWPNFIKFANGKWARTVLRATQVSAGSYSLITVWLGHMDDGL